MAEQSNGEKTMEHPGVSLIGAPTDVGAGTLGARLGPEALRVAGIARAIARCGRAVSTHLSVDSLPERA